MVVGVGNVRGTHWKRTGTPVQAEDYANTADCEREALQKKLDELEGRAGTA